jgi:hypothetical protein
MTDQIPEPDEMKKGVQPIDQVMKNLGLTDTAFVDKSYKKLSFRLVAKARKGRRLKHRNQTLIMRVLNECYPDKNFTFEDLFNYVGPKG